MSYHWTSEAVGPGHPDKVADQISDAILDAYLEQDSESKVACETMVKDNTVVLAGEITSTGEIDIEAIVRQTILGIGYRSELHLGFNEYCKIINLLTEQSPEINRAVGGSEVGAGDQGIMFGYADAFTPEYMPFSIYVARKLIEIAQETNTDDRQLLFPDCKSQVTVECDDQEDIPLRISHIVLSMHHHPDLNLNNLKELYHHDMLPRLEDSFIGQYIDDKTTHHINPAGPWNFGGPAADAGLTGRKIVVDNYGADCQIGGGAFSGKDATKVDRSAAYAARHIAKNIVGFGQADKAKVQLSYAIGEVQPISIHVDAMGTGPFSGIASSGITPEYLAEVVKKNWDLSPTGIIKKFGLDSPVFRLTARHGHFGIKPQVLENGFDEGWLWESLDAEFLEGL